MGKIEVFIGGKTRRATFGQNAWYLFTKMNSITPDKIRSFMADQLTNPTAFRDIIYCGFKASDMAQSKEVDYNEFVVGEWLDEAEIKVTQDLISCVLESLGIAMDEKPVKKKVNQKK